MSINKSKMTMPEPHQHETIQTKLEQFDPGMVWLDTFNHVVALNEVAMRILGPAAEQSLGVRSDQLMGIDVLQMHPDKSRDKLRLLLQSEDAAGCPVKSPPPVAMMINIPDRVLVIKVSKMIGVTGICGTCMSFYDLTDVTTVSPERVNAQNPTTPRRLFKIPVYFRKRVVLIDLKDVVRFQADGHYTTIVTKDDHFLSNLSLTDLEARLDSSIYFRTHRSHIVSLQYAVELIRGDESVSLMMADKENSVIPVSRSHAIQLKDLLGVA